MNRQRSDWQKTARWLGGLILALLLQSGALVQAAQAQSPVEPAEAADTVIYADALAAGWEDWSWDTTRNLTAINPVHGGVAAISVRFDAAWAGFYLHADPAVSLAGYTHLRFWLNGLATGGQRINIVANNNNAAAVEVTATKDVWTEHNVALADLGNPATLADLFWQDATGDSQPGFYMDDISLVSSGGGGGSSFPEPTADDSVGGLDQPTAVAFAPSGRVYVAMWGNPDAGRPGEIWSWPSGDALMSGGAPDLTLGTTANTRVGNPEALVVDSQNRLYVADTYNHRVLVYNTVTNEKQPDFLFGSNGASTILENKFQFTRGLAVDSQNHLYVTDEFNNRILVYNLPIASNNPTPIAQYTGLNGPRAVAVDASDDIYIADSENAVVKVFDGPAAPGGPYNTPTRTIGQPHNAAGCPTTAGSTAATYLACPIDVALDAAGRLYVSDTPNNRILGFAAGASSPTAVYGQADFTGYLPNRGGTVGNNTLRAPLGMDFDSLANFYVADFDNNRVLRFDAPTEPPPPPPPPPGDVSLTIDVGAQRHPISPYIYGMNFAPEALANELDLPVNRWGGNATSRYNYLTDISNHAMDWYFQNIKETDATNMPDDSWVNRLIDQNRRTGTESLLTLPMTGWVSNGVDRACGFAVAKYGPQKAVEPFGNKCGNGVLTNGTLVAGNDPADTSIAAPPSFAAGWVNFLKGKYGAAAAGGVRFYGLDNEPDIWWETHRDVQPVGWKYQELRDNTIAYAEVVKDADPGAQLLGPVVNGWTYYWYGAYDAQREDWNSPDDRLANGDMPFVPWYLQQMQQYETQNDVRLLDYLDLHYYPQAAGVALAEGGGNAATQALRLRSTRALWDPTYVDESWIKDAGPDDGIIRLLPRMREWVSQYYPGTKLAVSEYNWGALDHINGALAQAEVLGIFGREGLDLATLWAPPESNEPGAFAFRIYRNYDGQGSRFGDTSVQATSTDAGKLSIFAAGRADGTVTAVVINKTDGALTADLTVANATLTGSGEWRRYSASNLTAITAPTSFTLTNGATEMEFPAQSITLLVMEATGSQPVGDERLYLPLLSR